MNDELLEYTFDEIEIGLKKEFQLEITESLVNHFAKISGDFSPIHIDENYAKGQFLKKELYMACCYHHFYLEFKECITR